MTFKRKETSPQVKPFHVFGVSKGVRNNLLFQDEETVIFPSGNHCVRYNIPQRHTEFIHVAEGSSGMQALALSPDRHYLAVSECGTITVYDLNDGKCTKTQVLTHSDHDVKEFVCMAFSADSKYLLGQAGGPTWSLFYWNWKEQELIASVRATKSGIIKQVSFNPEDDKQVCVSGKGVFKIFELKEHSLTQKHSFKMDDVLCHTWMSGDSIVAGTEAGQLLMLKSGCLHQLDNPYEGNEEMLDSSSFLPPLTFVSAIVRHSKGFACSSGLGLVCVYEETKEKDYRKTGTIRIPVDPKSAQPLQTITTMCVSPSGETLAISTDQGQLYHINFRSVEISKNNKAEFNFLSHPFHSGSITGLSVCVTKPLMATCSTDRTVHIWNYKTKSLVQFKQFDKEPLCVSIHPNGLFILVGFSTEVRLMNLLRDDMRTVQKFRIKNCTECVFNHSGHMFAVVNKKKIHTVNVWTGEIKELKGYSEMVQSVKWSDDDAHLVSCGMDGLVYVWDVLAGTYVFCNEKSACYADVTFSPNSKSVIAVDRNKICEIDRKRILFEMASDDVEYTAISMTRSGRTVFVGTAAGTVRVMDYPFEKEMTWKEHQAHSGPITKMVVTAGDQYLLTASEDGCLFIWTIIDQDGRTLEMVKDIDYTEEVLCTEKFLKEKDEKINELMQQIECLDAWNEFTMTVKEKNLNKQMDSSIQKCLQQIAALEEEIQVLNADRQDQTLYYETMLTELKEQQAQELLDQRESFSVKLAAKFEKYENLKQEFQLMQEDFEMKLKQAEKSHLCTMEENTQAYEAKLQKLQAKLEQEIKDTEEKLKNLKDLAEHEIMDLCYEFDQELEMEKEIRLRAQCFKKKMESKISTLPSVRRVTESQSSHISELEEQMQNLREQMQNVTINTKDMENEMEQQSQAIVEQESCIEELNKMIENLELSLKEKEEEMVKALLKYRGSEEERKQRKEQERIEYEHIVKETEENKETYIKIWSEVNRRKQKQQEAIDDVNRQLQSLDKTLYTDKLKIMDTNILLQRMKSDLNNCSSFIQEPKKLRNNFIALLNHHTHIKTDVELDAQVVEQQTRQIEHLSKAWESQTSRLTKEIKTGKAKNYKMVMKGTSLIKELQDQQLKHQHVLKSLRDQNITYDETRFPAISVVEKKPVFRPQHPADQRQTRNLLEKRRGQTIALQKPASSFKLPPI
ncbi:cilia- and flagella-associated protein 57-like [Hemibagrus wyckioides]|uniref:cilia- and flagella-associated protein 57-like n=1 Tax=Hemibagrus wyckioides TaxID=337641 RepID=UPI00266D0A5C|nr:cilia- and flagella-associated protein 57-like [Hemibagrus wyckioides]